MDQDRVPCPVCPGDNPECPLCAGGNSVDPVEADNIRRGYAEIDGWPPLDPA